MSISTITVNGSPVTLVAMPQTPGLRLIEGTAHDGVALETSPYTGQSQAQKWLGADLLKFTLTLPALLPADERAWISFLMQLRGMANAFQMDYPLRPLLGTGLGAAVVNNTGGVNLAGSEQLVTQGWQANSLVLKQGDQFQLGWHLYFALDDVTSDGSGNATIPIWPALRETPANNGFATRQTNASASIAVNLGRPLGATVNGALWSGFALSGTLPSDAVITGIYPVLVASAVNPDSLIQYLTYGAGLPFGPTTPPTGSGFTHGPTTPTNPKNPGAAFSSGTFWDASIGTALSALAGMNVAAAYSDSVFGGPLTDTMAVTAVGFAIYYTSAAPFTDPQIAPPFAVPGGSGLAWALPAATANTGSSGTGVTTSTACVDNGGVSTSAAKGLFRLATNDRPWSADYTRLSRVSFQVQEWR